MTGRYPMRYGLQTGVIPSGAAYGLAEDEVTLPQVLKRAGYSTIMVGKWHLGHAKQSQWPKQRGFDYAYGPLIGEIDHFKHTSHGIRDWFRNNVPVTEPGYDTDLFGNDAIKQIDAHDPKKPLFLYLAFTAPHSPYQAPQDQLDRNKHIADPQRRAYAGQMTAMDDQIGRVLKALERRGMRDNTLIIFHSDNGGTRNKMFAGEAAVSGDLPPQNTPLRDGKGSLYEGGVRTGAIMNWPGKITPGTAKGMMHVVDMMPTLAALAGASTAGTKPLDGMDVWAAVTGGASPRKEVLLNIDPTGGALRDGDWKMVWLAGVPGSVQLYNLANDVGEKTDVAAANPEVVARMQARIVDYAKQMTPPLFAREAIRATYGNPPPFGKKPKSPDYEED
jgi:arylsulfatase A-like enzyme